MHRRTFTAVLTTLALPLAAAAAQQQPVTLRVAVQQGQTARFRTDVESWINLAELVRMGADTSRPATMFTMYTTRTVVAVRGDTAVLRDVVDSAEASAPAVRDVNAMELANAALAMRGITTLSALDGRGRLLDYAAGTRSQAQLAPPVQAVVPMAGLLRMMFAFPARPVRVGESWTESLTGGGEDGTLTMSGTFTLERTLRQGSANVAVIGIAGQLGGGGPGGALAARIAGQLEYDMTASQPTRFVLDIVGQLASPQGSVPMRVRRTVTRVP